MAELARQETAMEFRGRVAQALVSADQTARWVAEASAAGEAQRDAVPFDGNGFVWVEVVDPSRRLLHALKILVDASREADGCWRVPGEWDRSRSQKLSVQAPPCEAAVRVLNRELGDHGRFVAKECVD